MTQPFTENVLDLIKKIPKGKIATYGQIAAHAGNPRGARQVSRILHSCSTKYKLPWHRVINSKGSISLPPGSGYEEQRELLEKEGIRFNEKNRIRLKDYLWDIPITFNKKQGSCIILHIENVVASG